MKWHRILVGLVVALPVLVVCLAVVSGAAVLTDAVGDSGGRRVLAGVAVGLMILTTADVLLLVGVLGMRALDQDAHRRDRRRRHRVKHRPRDVD